MKKEADEEEEEVEVWERVTRVARQQHLYVNMTKEKTGGKTVDIRG